MLFFLFQGNGSIWIQSRRTVLEDVDFLSFESVFAGCQLQFAVSLLSPDTYRYVIVIYFVLRYNPPSLEAYKNDNIILE